MQRLVRSADQAAYQACSRSSVQARLFRLARGITWGTRGGHNYRGTARDYLCTRGSTGECTVAIVRTGVAWSSLVCWLVILIGAGSSEVGARSAPVGRKRGARACKVTGDWGPSCPPVVRGGGCARCIAVQRGQGAGQADQCAGSGTRRWARQRRGRRRLAWPGGSEASRAAGPARLMGSAHTAVAVVTASLHVIGPSQLTQLARCRPQLARCSLCGGQTANENPHLGSQNGTFTGVSPLGFPVPGGSSTSVHVAPYCTPGATH